MKTMKNRMMWAVRLLLCIPVAVASGQGELPVPDSSAMTGDAAWLKQAREHVLTPLSDRPMPVCVTRTEGKVEGVDALLVEDGRSCRLTYENGGVKPVVILDFGKQGVGGFAGFTVTAKTGLPVVRLAYACHPDGIGETGCTDRGSRATYLGGAVDLPVLPANVNRHETYTIPRTGRFIAPLVQGHILGVTPTAPGFSRFQVRPTPVKEVTWARGVVPTPHGPIAAGWDNAGKIFKLDLTVPQGTQAEVVLPQGGTVFVNGKPGDVQGLKKGVYAIEVRDLPSDAWADPAENKK